MLPLKWYKYLLLNVGYYILSPNMYDIELLSSISLYHTVNHWFLCVKHDSEQVETIK